MLSHVVLFWLKPDLTPAQRDAFMVQVRTLETIPGVLKCHIGTPASTDRPVIDRTYSVGLNLIFADLAAHDAYQIHPTHLAFVGACKAGWSRVLVYDFEG